MNKSYSQNQPSIGYYVVSLMIFLVSVGIGILYANHNPNLIYEIKGSYQSLNILRDLPPLFLLLFIFLNNTIKMFLVMFFGFFFGIAPVYFVVLNGFTIGVVSLALIQGAGYKTLIAGILPHGIFELSALIIVISYGFWLASKFIGSLRHRNKFIEYQIKSIKFFAKVILPILIVAALIETFLTPYLINLTLR